MSYALAPHEPVGVRRHLDQYYTPQPVADALVAEYLRHHPVPIRALEPNVGRGAWSRAVGAHMPRTIVHGVDIESRDPEDHCCHEFTRCDFLELRPQWPDLIIGNPPYNNAEAHIRHALDIVQPCGRVAFLLRLAFCESQSRIEFWRDHPAATIHVLAERPSFTGGKTDTAAYGFFVWQPGYSGPTVCYPGFSWRTPKELAP
jgi:hypothetical protein